MFDYCCFDVALYALFSVASVGDVGMSSSTVCLFAVFISLFCVVVDRSGIQLVIVCFILQCLFNAFVSLTLLMMLARV